MFFNNEEKTEHTFRDRRPCTTASQVAERCEHKYWNSLEWGKNYFVLGWPEQPRRNKSLLYWHDEPNASTNEGPFHLYSSSPHSLQFQQSAGAGTPLWSHWEKHPKDDLMGQSCVLVLKVKCFQRETALNIEQDLKYTHNNICCTLDGRRKGFQTRAQIFHF